MKRKSHHVPFFLFVFVGFIAFGTATIAAESFDLTTVGRFDADSNGAYWGVEGDFALESDLLSAYADLEFMSDGEWLATESWMPEGFFFDLKYGYFTLDFDRLYVDGGFIPATHLYSQNPYELILDGSGKPAVGSSYRYEGDLFTYQSRWIALNRMSPFVYEYPDDPRPAQQVDRPGVQPQALHAESGRLEGRLPGELGLSRSRVRRELLSEPCAEYPREYALVATGAESVDHGSERFELHGVLRRVRVGTRTRGSRAHAEGRQSAVRLPDEPEQAGLVGRRNLGEPLRGAVVLARGGHEAHLRGDVSDIDRTQSLPLRVHVLPEQPAADEGHRCHGDRPHR